MTATIPAPTATEQAALLTGVVTALVTDAERFDLAPCDVNVHSHMGYTSAAVAFPTGSVPAVDALASAYGLPAADPTGGLYSRSGHVVADGRDVYVLLYCARPVEPPALPVPAERADTPRALS